MPEVEIKKELNYKISVNLRNFKDEDDFLSAFEEYVSWCENNDFQEHVIMGKGTGYLSKMRMVSVEGFCRYLRHTPNHFTQTIKTNKLENALEFIQTCIYSMSLEAAAAGMIKESIIIRKLGLAEKVEKTNTEKRIVIMHTPDNGRTIEISEDDVKLLE